MRKRIEREMDAEIGRSPNEINDRERKRDLPFKGARRAKRKTVGKTERQARRPKSGHASLRDGCAPDDCGNERETRCGRNQTERHDETEECDWREGEPRDSGKTRKSAAPDIMQ